MKSQWLRFAFALLLASLLAAPVPAIDLSASPEVIEKQKQSWIERIRREQHSVERAQAGYANAVERYQRMKIRRKERGDERATIVEQMESSEQALTEARKTLEATLLEARREGVPPGWLRDAAATSPAALTTD